MKKLIAAALAVLLAASCTPMAYAAGYVSLTGSDNVTPITTANPLQTANVATPGTLTAASGNVANANAVATLAGAAGKTTYIIGFQCTAAGATGAAVANLTVAGVITGTMTYTFVFPAGATVAATPLNVFFASPIPASATNTAIVVTLPAGGTGNTNAACNAQGFQQ